jgi:hypothetical protein
LPSLSPIVVAVVIAGLVAAVGIALNATKRDLTFAGYESAAADLKRIKRRVRGHLHRDGKDLVITGEWRGLPLTLRFSHREDAPGVHVRMGARATFSLQIAAPGGAGQPNRAVIRIPELRLEPRFALRSDSPAEARLFAAEPKVVAAFQGICCSRGVTVDIERGAIEVAQSSFPQHYLARRVLRQIGQIAELAAAFEAMPHSDLIHVPAIRRQRGILGRAAMVTGMVATVVAVASASYETNWKPGRKVVTPVPKGMSLSDTVHINGIWRWRLAEQSDFDAAGIRWLGDHNQPALAKFDVDLGGNGSSAVAYALARTTEFRIVVLENSDLKYDATYPKVAFMARVPAQALSQIEWAAAPANQPDGDGILLVMHTDDPTSGILLYSHEGRVYSAAPANYQSIPFE